MTEELQKYIEKIIKAEISLVEGYIITYLKETGLRIDEVELIRLIKDDTVSIFFRKKNEPIETAAYIRGLERAVEIAKDKFYNSGFENVHYLKDVIQDINKAI